MYCNCRNLFNFHYLGRGIPVLDYRGYTINGLYRTMNNEQSQIRGDYRIFVGAFPTGDLTERIQTLCHYGPATLEN